MSVKTNDVRQWILSTTGKFCLDNIRHELNINREDFAYLRVVVRRLVEDGICVSMGANDGWYRKVEDNAKPVQFWKTNESGIFDFQFPIGTDGSSFGFEDKVQLHRGDAIVYAGVKDSGKTAMAFNLLFRNMDKYHCTYLINEYSIHKWNNRLSKFNDIDIFKGPDICKFDLIPISDNFEDAIKPGDINIIDWINFTEDIWKIGRYIKVLKDKVDDGLLIAVLQKNAGRDSARGGSWALDFADFGFMLDKNILTVSTVKTPKDNKFINGHIYGFDLVDGAHFSNIHEVIKCPSCKGFGNSYNKTCNKCHGTGYLDKDRGYL